MSRAGAADTLEVLEHAVQLARSGESFAMATVVWRQGPSSGQHGSRAVVTEDGTVHGWIGGACAEPVLIREAKRVLADHEPRLLWLGQADEFDRVSVPDGVITVPISCQSDGALQIFIEPVIAVPSVLVVGRSPMASTLTSLVADLGWHVTAADAAEIADVAITSATIVIVATQGHGDEDVIETVLRGSPLLVGLVASRKRGDAVRAFLADRGASPTELSALRIPMGLDLGHTSHREIAVSIVAELVKMRAAGELRPGAIAAAEVAEPSVVIDLVCGMSVEPVAANRPFEFQGATYYFCAPGCRVAFAKDPEAFIVNASTPQEAPC